MKKFVFILLFSLSLTSLPAYAEDHHQHHSKAQSDVESLSPELRELLKKEMLALQDGMMSIIPAYVSGDWSKIKTIADKMQNSYILKQNLSDKQKHELHSQLPAQFIKQDQQFHYLAGMLKHVAEEEKTELVGFYFSKLSEACVSCHSKFATHKFPALLHKKKHHHHSH